MQTTAPLHPPRAFVDASAAARGWRRPDSLGFWLLIAAGLIPVWSARYFPSQDGPAHVYNALVLRDFHRPAGAIFRQYFELNPGPEPNLLGHWILTGLLCITPAWIAEKLLISLYLVLLPLSARYAVRSVSRDASFAAFLIFPLVYSIALHKGLYNFCLGLPLFLFFVGFWLRSNGRFKARGLGTLLVLSLLLYFAHLVAMLSAYAAVGMLALTELLVEESRRDCGQSALPTRPRNIVSRLLLPAIALLPALLLAGRFFQQHHGELDRIQPVARMLNDLLRLSPLISYRNSEHVCSRLVAMLFAILTVCGLYRVLVRRQWSRADLLLPALAVSLLLYFLTPNTAAGGGLITPRLMLFCYLLLILWLAGTTFPRWVQWAVRGAAALLFLWMLGTYTVRYRQLNVYLKDYAECAPFIERHSTLLPIVLSDRGSTADGTPLVILHGARSFLHAAAYVAVARNLVDLSNYEATQGYFPTLFRPDVSPEERVHDFGKGLADYPRATGGRGRIDYVLIWDVREKDAEQKLAAVRGDLESGYTLIHTSPRGFVKLYRRK